MAKRTAEKDREERTTVCVSFLTTEVKQIDDAAEGEVPSPSRSYMIRKLVTEALSERRRLVSK